MLYLKSNKLIRCATGLSNKCCQNNIGITCSNCSGNTPLTIKMTISGGSDRCITGVSNSGNAIGLNAVTEGEYTLTQVIGSPCAWTYTKNITTIHALNYNNGDCTGGITSDVSVTSLLFRVVKVNSTLVDVSIRTIPPAFSYAFGQSLYSDGTGDCLLNNANCPENGREYISGATVSIEAIV